MFSYKTDQLNNNPFTVFGDFVLDFDFDDFDFVDFDFVDFDWVAFGFVLVWT